MEECEKKNNKMRLNHAISSTGFCSRRKADQLIFEGKVKINGMQEKNPGYRIDRDDVLEVDGKVLRRQDDLVYIYIMLNKPPQYVCTMSDPQGRPTVLDLLPENLKAMRPFPVGRLDYFSEGLLLMTNDGDLCQKLTHPRHHQPKTYNVLVRGTVSPNQLDIMRSGMLLSNGTKLLPVEIEPKFPGDGNTLLTMTLWQGLNRQIRKMCADLNLIILQLKRISQSGLRLGNLRRGASRLLDKNEIKKLKDCAGE